MIKQKHISDCGVACLAMFLQKTYEEIEDFLITKLRKKTPIPELNREEIAIVLNFFGKTPMTLFTMAPNVPAIISVPSLGQAKHYHYIYFDGKDIFDPSSGPCYTNKDFKDHFPLSDSVVSMVKFYEQKIRNDWYVPSHLYNQFDWGYIKENYHIEF